MGWGGGGINGRWGGGVPETPKNGTQNKTVENKGRWRRRRQWQRRWLRLFYTNPLNRDEMKARGDGWRRMMEAGKKRAGEWVSNARQPEIEEYVVWHWIQRRTSSTCRVFQKLLSRSPTFFLFFFIRECDCINYVYIRSCTMTLKRISYHQYSGKIIEMICSGVLSVGTLSKQTCNNIKIDLYFKLLSFTILNQHTVIVTIIIFHHRGYDYILLSTWEEV